MKYVLGFTVVNDVTARDFQKQDGIFTRGKGFDSFCPIGPWIVKTTDLRPRRIQCWVNEQLRQDSTTGDLLFGYSNVDFLCFKYRVTLLPGDIIATGTPSGVGPLKDGDTVRITIEGIGTLVNPVINREDRCFLQLVQSAGWLFIPLLFMGLSRTKWWVPASVFVLLFMIGLNRESLLISDLWMLPSYTNLWDNCLTIFLWVLVGLLWAEAFPVKKIYSPRVTAFLIGICFGEIALPFLVSKAVSDKKERGSALFAGIGGAVFTSVW